MWRRADAHDTLEELRRVPQVDASRFDAAPAELREHGWIDERAVAPAGRAARDRLVAARTDLLRELIADWEPDRYPELDPLLRRLGEELTPGTPR